MKADKRRWDRVDVSVMGTFVLPRQYSHGKLHAVDFCRQGIRAQLQRSIPRGTTLGVEMRLPGKENAVWLTGRVMWVKINPEPSRTYPFETGIHLDTAPHAEETAFMLAGYEDEQLAKIAETARYKGILFGSGVRARDDYRYLLPAGVVVYSAMGALATFIFPAVSVYYLASLAVYFAGVCAGSYLAYRRNSDVRGMCSTPQTALLLAANSILIHLCRGIYFLGGAFKKGERGSRAQGIA